MTEMADNLGRQMENTRMKKYLKQKPLETIEKLENEKMEVIFTHVKRGIKTEKLDVTSESVLQMLGALRNKKADDDKPEVPTNAV